MPAVADRDYGCGARHNDLEVTVANLWVNRLIGDAGLPLAKCLAWTTWNPYKADSPLLESGLLGPVRLERVGLELGRISQSVPDNRTD